MKKSNLDQWICETEHIQTLTRASLEKIQLNKLNLLLQTYHAKNTAGTTPEKRTYPQKLASLDELSTLPFTTSQMLSETPGKFLLTSQADISRVISGSTSGTTGPSKRVFYTKQDTEHTISFFAAGISEMLQPEESVLIDFPFSGTSGLGDLIEKAVISIGAHSIRPCKEHSFLKKCLYIMEQKPVCYIGAAVPLLSLIRCCQLFFPNQEFPVRRALVSGDSCPASVTFELEKMLHSKLFPHYGSRECGLGGAITCSAHEGMHLRENHIIAEIIDSDLKPVPPGEWGELVLTTIGLSAMPLIRYRTGDYTRILPESCPCGSITLRLDHISRLSDTPFTQEMLDNQLFSIPEIIDYQASLNIHAQNHLAQDLSFKNDSTNHFIPICQFQQPILHIDALVSDKSCEKTLLDTLHHCCPDFQLQITTQLCQPEDIPFYSGKRYLGRR